MKSFKKTRVLNGVSFKVNDGRIAGFLGANGSGKTTTVRVILGIMDADSGVISIDASSDLRASQQRIGYLPEERGLYPSMSVQEQLTYFGRLRGLNSTVAKQKAMKLMQELNIEAHGADSVQDLSLGNQQRVQLAVTLIHDPTLIILDEPFSGLDVLAAEDAVRVLRDRAAAGASILLSSHQLDLIERVCDDILLLESGIIRTHGPLQQVLENSTALSYEIRTSTPLHWLRSHDAIEILQLTMNHAVFRASNQVAAQSVLSSAITRGPVEEFTRQRLSLADLMKGSSQCFR